MPSITQSRRALRPAYHPRPDLLPRPPQQRLALNRRRRDPQPRRPRALSRACRPSIVDLARLDRHRGLDEQRLRARDQQGREAHAEAQRARQCRDVLDGLQGHGREVEARAAAGRAGAVAPCGGQVRLGREVIIEQL